MKKIKFFFIIVAFLGSAFVSLFGGVIIKNNTNKFNGNYTTNIKVFVADKKGNMKYLPNNKPNAMILKPGQLKTIDYSNLPSLAKGEILVAKFENTLEYVSLGLKLDEYSYVGVEKLNTVNNGNPDIIPGYTLQTDRDLNTIEIDFDYTPDFG